MRPPAAAVRREHRWNIDGDLIFVMKQLISARFDALNSNYSMREGAARCRPTPLTQGRRAKVLAAS